MKRILSLLVVVIAALGLTLYVGASVLPASKITAEAVSDSKVTLSWSKVSGAVKYTVYMLKPGTYRYTNIGSVTKTSVPVYNLKSSSTYMFKVTAVDAKGKLGRVSTSVSVSTPAKGAAATAQTPKTPQTPQSNSVDKAIQGIWYFTNTKWYQQPREEYVEFGPNNSVTWVTDSGIGYRGTYTVKKAYEGSYDIQWDIKRGGLSNLSATLSYTDGKMSFVTGDVFTAEKGGTGNDLAYMLECGRNSVSGQNWTIDKNDGWLFDSKAGWIPVSGSTYSSEFADKRIQGVWYYDLGVPGEEGYFQFGTDKTITWVSANTVRKGTYAFQKLSDGIYLICGNVSIFAVEFLYNPDNGKLTVKNSGFSGELRNTECYRNSKTGENWIVETVID